MEGGGGMTDGYGEEEEGVGREEGAGERRRRECLVGGGG